ncbi:FUSC family protein [Ureibacillus composti]
MWKPEKTPSIFKQALKVNKKPFPWLKAFLAGVAAGLPICIGLLFGSLEYGLIAGLGGFTYLYVFPIPYAQLAKKLTFCVLGITACVFLGTIAAPYPIITAFMMGIIGSLTMFIFGAFRLIGPSAIFFVLVFAMTTGMPTAPNEAFFRAGLTFLGGVLSWIIAMSGWLFNPHGPEKDVVKRTYIDLANLVDSIGTEKFNDAKNKVMSSLKEADQTLTVGNNPWHTKDIYKRLIVLNIFANKIFLYVVDEFDECKESLSSEFGEAVRIIAGLIESGSIVNDSLNNNLPHPNEMDEKSTLLFMEITAAKDSLNESSLNLKEQMHRSSPSAKQTLLGAFDKNSIIFINALRFGLFIILAAILAYEFELNRSFWVPLSCVAVMSGANAVATFHRAIQRSFGTVVGILIASVILAFHPSGFVIPFLVFLLTFITELFIVKNYGLAALFFTPNALLMAESGSQGKFAFTYFASARLIDVVIGIIIGLIGVWFVGKKSASSRLPHLVSKTIRSQAQVLFALFSGQERKIDLKNNTEINKMQTNIKNLKTVYDTATGEIPVDKKAIEYYWAIVYSVEQLGFLLEKYSNVKDRPVLSEKKISQFLFIFETMAIAANRQTRVTKKEIPEINELPSIQYVVEDLQKNFQKLTYSQSSSNSEF